MTIHLTKLLDHKVHNGVKAQLSTSTHGKPPKIYENNHVQNNTLEKNKVAMEKCGCWILSPLIVQGNIFYGVINIWNNDLEQKEIKTLWAHLRGNWPLERN